jgi:hypothetical protein
VEHTPLRQRRDGLAGLEGGVEVDQGIGPEAPTSQFRVDEVVDLRVVDAQEALDVGAVLGNDRLAQLKDIHILPVVLCAAAARRVLMVLRASYSGLPLSCYRLDVMQPCIKLRAHVVAKIFSFVACLLCACG